MSEIDDLLMEYAFWVGRLSRAVPLAREDIRVGEVKSARQDLEVTLEDFLRSPVPSDGLRREVRS